MNSEDKTIKEGIFSNDWLQFLDDLKTKSSSTFILGFILLIIAGLSVGYIGSLRVQYSKSFYKVDLSLNFLEDILPGTKIRYQGGLVVGEVLSISSNEGKNLIHVQLKKDFTVPKLGSRISLQSWGYFGAKFINISIITSYTKGEMYQPGDTLPVISTTNSTIIMNDFYQMIKKDDNQLSPLEKKLADVIKLTRGLSKSNYARPLYMRRLLHKNTRKANKYFRMMNNAGIASYSAILNLNTMAENIIGNLSKQLPYLKKQAKKSMLLLKYPSKIETPALKFWHEETTYDEILEYTKYIKERTAEFRDNPYLILYGG